MARLRRHAFVEHPVMTIRYREIKSPVGNLLLLAEGDGLREIRFLGESVAGLASHQIMRRGIVQVPEGRMIFADLTIEENLRLGAYNASD